MKPPNKGGLFYNNKTAFVDSTLNANKDKEWVQRLYKKNTPRIVLPGEDRPSTHLMSDDGNGYVFPSLVVKPGQSKLTNLDRRAEDYARDTNTGIQFKKKVQGDYFASHNNGNGSYGGYKKGTGVLPEFKDGVKNMKTKYKRIKKAVNGLNDVAVPEAGSGSNVLAAGASGAAAGASFGPYGAIIGAGIGTVEGAIQKDSQDQANEEAVTKNKYAKANRMLSATDSSINQKYQIMKKGINGVKPYIAKDNKDYQYRKQMYNDSTVLYNSTKNNNIAKIPYNKEQKEFEKENQYLGNNKLTKYGKNTTLYPRQGHDNNFSPIGSSVIMPSWGAGPANLVKYTRPKQEVLPPVDNSISKIAPKKISINNSNIAIPNKLDNIPQEVTVPSSKINRTVRGFNTIKTKGGNYKAVSKAEEIEVPKSAIQSTYKTGTKMIEIEGKGTPEIHTDKNFNIKNLGSIPHSKGGNKVEASEGDIVFNTQNSLAKYNKIASAIQSGDHKTLKVEKNKLPDDDSNKAQDGKRGVKTERKYYLNSYGDKVYQNGKIEGSNPATNNTYPKAPLIYDSKTWKAGKNYLYNNMSKRDSIQNNIYKPKVAVKPTTPINTATVRNNTFDLKNPLSIPGVPSSITSPNSYKSSTPIKSPVGTKGKKIMGNSIATSPAPQSKLSTDFGNSNTSDGSDLKGQYLNNQFASPSIPINTIGNLPVPNTSNIGGDDGLTDEQKAALAKKKAKKDAIDKAINTGMQLTGVANNLIQGLKTEKPINQTYFDPKLNKYVDRSQTLRNESVKQNNLDNSNARNLSGGLGSNLRANMQVNGLQNYSRQEGINEREMSKADVIDAENTNIKNQAGQYNLQRKDMYQQQIDGQKAAKQAYVDQAASDIGKIGNVREQQTYQKSRDVKADEMQLAGLKAQNGSSSFKYNTDGSYTFDNGGDNATNNRYTGADLYPLPQTNNRRKTMRRGTGIYGGYKKGTKYIKSK